MRKNCTGFTLERRSTFDLVARMFSLRFCATQSFLQQEKKSGSPFLLLFPREFLTLKGGSGAKRKPQNIRFF